MQTINLPLHIMQKSQFIINNSNIDICYNFLVKEAQNVSTSLKYLPSNDSVTDKITKAASRIMLDKLFYTSKFTN